MSIFNRNQNNAADNVAANTGNTTNPNMDPRLNTGAGAGGYDSNLAQDPYANTGNMNTGAGHHHHHHGAGTATTAGTGAGMAGGMGSGTGMGGRADYGQTQTGMTTSDPYASENLNATNLNNPYGSNEQPVSNDFTTGITGTTGAQSNYANPNTTTPSSALQTNTSTSPTMPDLKLAKKEERSGKIQHTLGTILCAPGMKAKGEMKLEHAEAIREQSAHIGEAERLEQEAKVHRDRADAHGMVVNQAQQGNFGSNP